MSSLDLVIGLPAVKLKRKCKCITCILAKHHREKAPKQATMKTTRALELVHNDLYGPIDSGASAKYILTFTDDYSRFTWTYFLTCKSDTFTTFKIFHATVEKEFSLPISCLCTDRGGEYMLADFNQYCLTHGIRRQLTAARTPHQNGVAERKNRTILKAARVLYLGSTFPTFLWQEAVQTAVYILNHCATRALHLSTPYMHLYQRRLDLSNLRVIGCRAFVLLPKQPNSKFRPKGLQTVLLGYDQHTKAYRCFDPAQCKILISKDVICVEDSQGEFFFGSAPTDIF